MGCEFPSTFTSLSLGPVSASNHPDSVTSGDVGNSFALGLGWGAAEAGSQVGFQEETCRLQHFWYFLGGMI